MCTHSLAELREYMTKPEQLGSDTRTPASRACVQLVISTIPSQEVQGLIEDIAELDVELLKVNLVQYLYLISSYTMNKI